MPQVFWFCFSPNEYDIQKNINFRNIFYFDSKISFDRNSTVYKLPTFHILQEQ